MERGLWESGGKFWRWFSCRWTEGVWEEPLHREKPSHSNEMFFSEVGFYRLSSNKGGHERDVLRACYALLHDCSPSESTAALWGMKKGHMISNLITIKKLKSMCSWDIEWMPVTVLMPQFSFLLKLSRIETGNCSPLAGLWAFLCSSTGTVTVHCQHWRKELTSSFVLTMSGQRKACHLMQPEVRLAELRSRRGQVGGVT